MGFWSEYANQSANTPGGLTAPGFMGVPTRDTDAGEVNGFNTFLKTQPWYQDFFRVRGLDPTRPSLSNGDQSALEALLKQHGVAVPEGMHIDQGGNLNQKNTLGKNLVKGAALTGAALLTAGAAGIGPTAGLFGGAAAPAGVAGTTIAPGAGAFVAPSIAGAAGGGALAGTPIAAGVGAFTAPSIAGAATAPALGSSLGLFSRAGLPKLAQAGGSALSNAADSMAANRGATDQANYQQDNLRLRAGEDDEQALQNRAKLAMDTQNDAYHNALRSAFALNAKDVSFGARPDGVPTFDVSGGARPSALGPQGQDAAAELNRRALEELMNPQGLPARPTFTPSALSKPGVAERVLGPLGFAARAGGALFGGR